MGKKIGSTRFYFEYKGHPIEDLQAFYEIISSERPGKPIIYLAGDSSLDNKFWLPTSKPNLGEPLPVPVPEIYELALRRPVLPKADVAFWLNRFLAQKGTALNLAVEASLLRERGGTALLEHDEFIRDHITDQDILVVSVGANDIAMRPTFSTIWHMLLLAWFAPLFLVRAGKALGLGYFVRMFKSDVERYISQLVQKHKPQLVIICMIYFPLEAKAQRTTTQKGWADLPLKFLGYNSFPKRLQTVISKAYELATEKIEIAGARVVPLRLSDCLDGKNEGDYVDRVEPSVEGGRKIASHLMTSISPVLGDEASNIRAP